MLKRRFPHGPIYKYGVLIAEVLTACHAYSFQTFSVGQVLTAAQMNQVEVNVRDHTHGSAGVTTGGIGLVLLSSQNASASSSVDFSGFFTATYDDYIIEFTNVLVATNTASLWGRVSIASSFLSANYSYGLLLSSSASVNAAGGLAAQGQLVIGPSLSNACYISGRIHIKGPLSTAQFKNHDWDCSFQNSGGDMIKASGGGGYVGGVGALDGFRFMASTGNITSGLFVLYGVRKT